ncbi:MAG: hypothetical protein GY804_06020 [Alphaproteobacteria bacterium]|nr:hypothetical protein [Alphaproteobacteria bacterium]
MNAQSVKEVDEFDVVENRAGKLMFVLHEQEGKPFENPTMTVDENNSATLYRSDVEAIKLVEIPEAVAKVLETLNGIMVTEMSENGDYAYVYDVEIVKNT